MTQARCSANRGGEGGPPGAWDGGPRPRRGGLGASQRVSGTGSEAAPEANEGYAMATRRREALATP